MVEGLARVRRPVDAIARRPRAADQRPPEVGAGARPKDLLRVGAVAERVLVAEGAALAARLHRVHPVRVELDRRLVGGDEEGVPHEEEREREEHRQREHEGEEEEAVLASIENEDDEEEEEEEEVKPAKKKRAAAKRGGSKGKATTSKASKASKATKTSRSGRSRRAASKEN